MEKTFLLNALDSYCCKEPVRLHVPGHGGGRAMHPALLMEKLPLYDVTELEGLDDLHAPDGAIAAAQEHAAELCGAGRTFFLVNGTTVGIQALITAATGEKNAVVLPRNAHRSVLGGLVLSGARPVFVEPEVVAEFGFCASYSADKLEKVLSSNKDITAALAVHPCYYGVVGDLAGIAGVCSRFQIPLLVDEAHGTHLHFHQDLPADALSIGADAVVQSVHKTGGALTQASWLHLGNRTRVKEEAVAESLRLLQTSSPSYLLLASLDAARQQLALKGQTALSRLLEIAWEVTLKLNHIPGLMVLGPEHLGRSGAVAHDPTRLVVSVRGLGLSGYEVATKLSNNYGIYVEMADVFNIVAVLSLGTDWEDAWALVRALVEIGNRVADGIVGGVFKACYKGYPLAGPPMPPQVMTPRQAWLGSKKQVDLGQTRGLISAEIIAVHPPGTAIIYPGEEITPEVIEYLTEARWTGLHLNGPSDSSLRTIKVVNA